MGSTESAQNVLVTMKGITKAYPGTLANDNIDLSVHRGQIHALLGENGAGKSTRLASLVLLWCFSTFRYSNRCLFWKTLLWVWQ